MEVDYDERYGLHVKVANPTVAMMPMPLPIECWRFEDKGRCGYCGSDVALAPAKRVQCDDCFRENWCSRECEKLARNYYHKKECELYYNMTQVAGQKYSSGLSTSALNFFRLWSILGTEALMKVGQYRENPPMTIPIILPSDLEEFPRTQFVRNRGPRGLCGLLTGGSADLIRNCPIQDAQYMANLIGSCFVNFANRGNEQINAHSIIRILGVIAMNSFEIEGGGFMLSCGAAFFNHSTKAPTHRMMEKFTPQRPPSLSVEYLGGARLERGQQCFIRYRDHCGSEPGKSVEKYYGIGSSKDLKSKS